MAYTFVESSSLRNRYVLRDGLFNKHIICTQFTHQQMHYSLTWLKVLNLH